jgi:hypothetical protein
VMSVDLLRLLATGFPAGRSTLSGIQGGLRGGEDHPGLQKEPMTLPFSSFARRSFPPPPPPWECLILLPPAPQLMTGEIAAARENP